MSSVERLKAVNLNEDNWLLWKLQMKAIFINLQVWDVVSGNEKPPVRGNLSEAEFAAESQKFVKRAFDAKSQLISHVDASQTIHIIRFEDVWDMWTSLVAHHESKSMEVQYYIREKIRKARLSDFSSMQAYLTQVNLWSVQLAQAGSTISEHEVVMNVLEALPQEFDFTRQYISPKNRTYSTIIP
jgi:hypothetical protein